MRLLHIFAAFAAFLLVSTHGFAHGYKIGDLDLHHPWTKATPPGAAVAGGYLEIKNNGTVADRLIGGTFAAAERLEIHQMSMDGDVMVMRKLDSGIEIAPGATVVLKPGGLHLMFMDLKSALVENDKIQGTLVFEKAGTVAVEFAVEAMGSKGSEEDHSKHMSQPAPSN